MPTSRDIRRQFIDYFAQRCGHTFVPSSPVVPHEDPTLLFTNAGMVQFKDVFLATGSRPYNRAVNSQKCIRAGGKHNDLEDVGKDTYHHTFFEMLGNWSFGDYFKKEAIGWAWDLLTNVWGLPKDRLYVTVFAGDQNDGVPADDEAAQLWVTVTDLDPSHVSRWGRKDNFWEMADTGPCGPNSEIHIDLTPDGSGASLVNRDDPRVVELWNLVFIQFNRNTDGTLTPLPAKHVDTGLGFERICSVLQNAGSNYNTDVFTPIFTAIADVTGTRPYGSDLQDSVDVAYRVIADHIRCLTFAITDAVLPSNEGRGYVLRRILRRAVRHGWQTMSVREPFLYRLVPAVVDVMGDAFPDLQSDPERVIDLVKEEEASFFRTLGRGIALFDQAASKPGPQINAQDAFMLHDTYGFPLDLTQIMAEERGLTIDVEGFNTLMDEARELARNTGGHSGLSAALLETVQKSSLPPTQFLGYDQAETKLETFCLLYRLSDNGSELADQVQIGEQIAVVVGKTPFYAEAGGQVGDTGVIENENGAVLKVRNTVKIGEVYFHLAVVESGTWRSVRAEETNRFVKLALRIDQNRRLNIMANHTATHMMNRALRCHVGPSVDQRGSLVDPDKTRFDFSHGTAMTEEQIELVEKTVNVEIAADLPVFHGNAPQEEAVKINGLRAVFGERYPPTVRIVSIGVAIEHLLQDPQQPQWQEHSVEFCGGTHLTRTGRAERFVIVSEEAVAKGVRRLTAVTGRAAEQATDEADRLQADLSALRDNEPGNLAAQIRQLSNKLSTKVIPARSRSALREALTELQKSIKTQQKQATAVAAGAVVDMARQLADQAGGNLIVAALENADAQSLRTAMDVIRKKRPDAAMLLATVSGNKVAFVASVPDDLIKQGLKAGDWVRQAAQVTGGGGGGRPDMAQAGGKDPAKLAEALEAGRTFAAKIMA